jgi:1-deoxy-D-xylulose-5-phosphate reductoisomerase
MKRIILLGATGSIGRSTLDVIRAHRGRFCLVAASAHTKRAELDAVAAEFGAAPWFTGPGRENPRDLTELIAETDADIVVNGISGSAGLAPSIASLESGKDVALANKETIVMAGHLVREVAERHGRKILPVDSEHAALFYLLEKMPRQHVRRLVLTASGGAFRDLPAEELAHVTVERALSHPTWAMGPKITIDSATMANKGLEIIEAVGLFDVAVEAIDVFIHRQSIVHGCVQTADGSLYAQLGLPDMRVPIQHALSYPEEIESPVKPLDLDGLILDFSAPDPAKYPALALARRAAELAGEYTIAYNAANEVAVAAFLDRRIRFVDIARLIDHCLAAQWRKLVASLEQVYECDEAARRITSAAIR